MSASGPAPEPGYPGYPPPNPQGYNPYAPGYIPTYPYGAPVPAPTNNFATISLVCGVVGLVTLFCGFGFLAGIVAVAFGHLALHEIKLSGGRLGGRAMAIWGLVLGYGVLVLYLAFFAFYAVFFAVVMPGLPTAPIPTPAGFFAQVF